MRNGDVGLWDFTGVSITVLFSEKIGDVGL